MQHHLKGGLCGAHGDVKWLAYYVPMTVHGNYMMAVQLEADDRRPLRELAKRLLSTVATEIGLGNHSIHRHRPGYVLAHTWSQTSDLADLAIAVEDELPAALGG